MSVGVSSVNTLHFLDGGQLTCSQEQGTSVCPGLLPGSVAAGTPRSAPAGSCHPGWRARQAMPGPRGTVGRQCPHDSRRSRCASTGASSRHRRGVGMTRGGGSGRAVGSVGTEDTPSHRGRDEAGREGKGGKKGGVKIC